MRKLTLPALLTTVLIGSPVFAEQWAQKMFADAQHKFGTIARGAKAEYEFTLKNIYLEDVRITGLRVSCGCTSVWIKDDKRVLKTYETSTIVAHINSSTFLGSKGATITVTFDKPMRAQAQLQVSAFIRNDVVLQPGSVELGSVDQGTAVQRKIRISSPGRSGLRLLEVKSTNPHLSGTLTESSDRWGQKSYELSVRLDPDAPAGYLKDHLLLVTNDSGRTQIPVSVEGRVVSGIEVSPQWLLLGTVEPGQKVSKMVIVRGKSPFRVTNVTSGDDAFGLAAPTGQLPKRAHAIPVTFVAGDRPGKIVRTIYIETDQGNQPVQLTAQAVVTGSRTAVAQVEEEEPAPVAPPANEVSVSITRPAEEPGTARAD